MISAFAVHVKESLTVSDSAGEKCRSDQLAYPFSMIGPSLFIARILAVVESTW